MCPVGVDRTTFPSGGRELEPADTEAVTLATRLRAESLVKNIWRTRLSAGEKTASAPDMKLHTCRDLFQTSGGQLAGTTP